MKYRKLPVEIEAEKFAPEMPKEFSDQLCDCLGLTGWHIHTLEGTSYQLKLGDYIIKGVKGEFYPCKPDIFEMTYEPVALTPTN